MIQNDIIKLSDVIFIYSKPPEQALMGVVRKIEYPIITIEVVKRDKNGKFKNKEKIDISEDIALTIFNEDDIKKYLTDKELKRLSEIKENEVIDMFEGMY